MYNGYEFYIDGMKLPIAPPSLEIKVGSKNETVDLINEGEINILKSPSLISVSFEARFPMRDYPYAPNVSSFDSYYEKIKSLKENKQPFNFVVARATPNRVSTWDTNIQMALEDFTLSESWDEGDDVLISFTLKQYKNYGTKTVTVSNGQIQKTSGASENRTSQPVVQENYKVAQGDTLYLIAKNHFGDGSRWTEIYEANKSNIESSAKAHGKESSLNGNYISPGLELVLPAG